MNQLYDDQNCPACGHSNASQAFQKGDYQFLDCLECRTWYLSPMPTSEECESQYHHPEEDLNSRVCWDASTTTLSFMTSHWQRCLSRLRLGQGPSPTPGESLLDIGCGSGQFLQLAKTLGWLNLCGLELNSQAANAARSTSQAKIYECTLPEANLPHQSLTAITLFDVVEHMPEPWTQLQAMATRLKPGGHIAIATANRFGLSMRLLQGKALTVCPPEHVILFSKRGLTRLLERAGFEIVDCWTPTIYIREWVHFLKPGRQAHASASKNLLQFPFMNVLIKIADVFLKLFGLGDQLYVVARKKTV